MSRTPDKTAELHLAPGGAAPSETHPAREPRRRRSPWAGPLLWTAQGWLAMFYLAAGYAKLTEPYDLMVFMLGWPEFTGPAVLKTVGAVEVGLAVLIVAPAFSWRVFHTPLLVALGGIAAMAAFMTMLHAKPAQAQLAIINIMLFGLAMAAFMGRRRRPL